jgi:TatD DNase family protein
MPQFADSHFHLLELEKRGIVSTTLLAEAAAQGIICLLDVGVDVSFMERRLALAARFPALRLAVGFSPAFVTETGWETVVPKEIKNWAGNEKVVAIGEIGLDYYRNYGTHNDQIKLFELQLELAKEFQLPVSIHNREANDDLLNILQRFSGDVTGALHCFSGDYHYAKKLLDTGFFISFAGNITYKKAEAIQDTARKIPVDRMLVETDAPYLSPIPQRGKINTPLFIVSTYAFIAKIRNKTTDDLGEQVVKNYYKLFLPGRGGSSSPSLTQQ